MSRESQPRQNYHAESEAGVNKQINLALCASYTLQSMAAYFDRDDVALHNFHKFFTKASEDERDHAEKLMEYQNKRGGRVMLQPVQKPEQDSWGSGLGAMQAALTLQKNINQSYIDLLENAEGHGDAQMSDFIEDTFLGVKVDTIKTLCDHITKLKSVGSGLGEFMYDQEAL